MKHTFLEQLSRVIHVLLSWSQWGYAKAWLKCEGKQESHFSQKPHGRQILQHNQKILTPVAQSKPLEDTEPPKSTVKLALQTSVLQLT